MTDLLLIAVLAFSFFGALAALAYIGDHLNLSQPEPRTRRPDPVDPCDFSEALRPIGGPPRWEDTKEQR